MCTLVCRHAWSAAWSPSRWRLIAGPCATTRSTCGRSVDPQLPAIPIIGSAARIKGRVLTPAMPSFMAGVLSRWPGTSRVHVHHGAHVGAVEHRPPVGRSLVAHARRTDGRLVTARSRVDETLPLAALPQARPLERVGQSVDQ